jgi:ASC-1-like (ASCH) protein
MIHRIFISPEPLEKIKSGGKTIEVRLLYPKRQKIKIGDEIIFRTRDNNGKIKVNVLALHKFSSFKELFEKVDNTKLGLADWRDMNKYYSPEKQKKYGVVGIEIG